MDQERLNSIEESLLGFEPGTVYEYMLLVYSFLKERERK